MGFTPPQGEAVIVGVQRGSTIGQVVTGIVRFALRYSLCKLDGFPVVEESLKKIPLTMSLACACRNPSFGVRIDDTEQVGLLTCGDGHHSLLLDSGDYWNDVIQDKRPKERKCPCGSRQWGVSLRYDFREDAATVRCVNVHLRCIQCSRERKPFNFEIDYAPTDELVTTPLHPCADPWIKAKRIALTGLWKPSDLDSFVRHAVALTRSSVFVAPWRQRPKPFRGSELSSSLDAQQPFDIFLTNVEVSFPENLRDCWKHLPVVHVGSPFLMSYRTGQGYLYYIQYAEEVFTGGQVRPQPHEFLDYAWQRRDWLHKTYSSARGKNTVDNPAEFERLKGGW